MPDLSCVTNVFCTAASQCCRKTSQLCRNQSPVAQRVVGQVRELLSILNHDNQCGDGTVIS